jgi:hypothetical protein
VLKIWTMTIAAPILSSFLFILVFGLSLGSRLKQVQGIDYDVFIVPGLITMAMIQAAYSNNSSSVFQARFDRYLNDILAAPMRPWEINLALSLGGVVRALGAACWRARWPSSTSRAPPVRACGAVRWRSCSSRRSASSSASTRQRVGPHGLRDEHRHPAADLPGRGLLLGRPPAHAMARDQPRQSDLLPAQRGALRLFWARAM